MSGPRFPGAPPSESRRRLRAIAEVVGYFPWMRVLAPTGRRLTGKHPRAAYWREYHRRRYHTDPAYRARRRESTARSRERKRLTALAARLNGAQRELGL